MTRNQRLLTAEETVNICKTGSYLAPSGQHVDIRRELAAAIDGTKIYSPFSLVRLNVDFTPCQSSFEVTNETTFHAIVRASSNPELHVACLNFASAKNPGGGFLNGSQAQEESLARSSGLYPCLLQANEYYQHNRANRSTLYLDLAVYSPHVPFFRDDEGDLLENPILTSVITAPAPNAGAIGQNEPHNIPLIESTFRRRAEFVLGIAREQSVHCLILGAWGCGVFRNDPLMVARIFRDLLTSRGPFTNVFPKVIFAVFDRSPEQPTFRAFQTTFGNNL